MYTDAGLHYAILQHCAEHMSILGIGVWAVRERCLRAGLRDIFVHRTPVSFARRTRALGKHAGKRFFRQPRAKRNSES